MLLNHYSPSITSKIQGTVQKLSTLIFLGIAVAVIAGNLENIAKYVKEVISIVMLQNVLAIFMGYQWAKMMGLSQRDRRAVRARSIDEPAGPRCLAEQHPHRPGKPLPAAALIFCFRIGQIGRSEDAVWAGLWAHSPCSTGWATAYRAASAIGL